VDGGVGGIRPVRDGHRRHEIVDGGHRDRFPGEHGAAVVAYGHLFSGVRD